MSDIMISASFMVNSTCGKRSKALWALDVLFNFQIRIFLIPPTHLVLKGRGEAIVEHFLVENRCDTSWHGRHNPHPVSRTATSHPVLILHVLHEGLCGWVMVYYGHFAGLKTRGHKQWTHLCIFSDESVITVVTKCSFLDQSWSNFTTQYYVFQWHLKVLGGVVWHSKCMFWWNMYIPGSCREQQCLSPPAPGLSRGRKSSWCLRPSC